MSLLYYIPYSIYRLYSALANIPFSCGVRLRLDGRSSRQNETKPPLSMSAHSICKHSPSKPSATGMQILRDRLFRCGPLVLNSIGAPEGYGRRWTASLDFEGQELDMFGEFVQQHGNL